MSEYEEQFEQESNLPAMTTPDMTDLAEQLLAAAAGPGSDGQERPVDGANETGSAVGVRDGNGAPSGL